MPTVSASRVSTEFVSELIANVSTLCIQPQLVGFLANDDPAAKMYADWTAKTCVETGIKFTLVNCSKFELEDLLVGANADENVHGIMVYYPVFGGNQDQYLQNTVDISKDVEGLCHTYRYNMYHNIRVLGEGASERKCIIPCTPLVHFLLT